MDLPGIMVIFLAFGVLLIAGSYLPWYDKGENSKNRERRFPRKAEMRISGGIFLLVGIVTLIGLASQSQAGFWTAALGIYEAVAKNMSHFETTFAIVVLSLGGSAIWYGFRVRSESHREQDKSQAKGLTQRGWLSLSIGAFLVVVGVVVLLM